jgi:hypothetical protein
MGSDDIRDWNEQVRGLANKLPDSVETKFGFACQCGCGTVVSLTSRNFDVNGAWADGHKPGAARRDRAGRVEGLLGPVPRQETSR